MKNRHFLRQCLMLLLLVQASRSTPAPVPSPPCPTNPYTSVSWIYNPIERTCIYPKIIPGRGDTGQQTDIIMFVEDAFKYVQSVHSPRELFLDSARLLNNRSLTNMSDEALAALVYAQVFVEEKWFKDYNWVHPYWNRNQDPQGGQWPSPLSLNGKRFTPFHLGFLNQWACDIRGSDWPHRLCGFGFGLGNQQLYQALDAGEWYAAYQQISANRYGLPSRQVSFKAGSVMQTLLQSVQNGNYPIAYDDTDVLLRNELSDAVQSQFWNVLRFVWAGARQREGIYPDQRTEDEKQSTAIDYRQLMGKAPRGRSQMQVSAFSLISTIYTDTITVTEVTGYGKRYIARDARTIETWKAFVSERNKAIRNIELLGNKSAEGSYRIQQGLGVGPLKTQYEFPIQYDFLPYSQEEVLSLINALRYEITFSEDQWVSAEASRILESALLLKQGYQYFVGKDTPSP